MRSLLAIVLCWGLAFGAAAQDLARAGACPGGRCPAPGVLPEPRTYAPVEWQVDSRAVAQVFNSTGSVRTSGSGTLVDNDGTWGLIVTCAHMFREGAGSIVVVFPGGRSYAARLLRVDTRADLAALHTAAPPVDPVNAAAGFPRRGDPLVSCGYGSAGRLECNFGTALGYVTTQGGRERETLEMTGAARLGDSGGPILNRQGQLVAVLFGTNGRVVDGTFCGRVRRFLEGLSPRFGARPSPPTPQPETDQPTPPPAAPPLEDVPPGKPPADAPMPEPKPPVVERPPEVGPLGDAADAVGKAAQPWLSAKLTTVLIAIGVPGGIAGVAGGLIVWLAMRRGKRRLHDRLARLRAVGEPTGEEPGSDPETQPATVERHHNRYVPYELSRLDKAWSTAHARVSEKYPGAVPYLKIVEGVKDQLLSGSDEAELS